MYKLKILDGYFHLIGDVLAENNEVCIHKFLSSERVCLHIPTRGECFKVLASSQGIENVPKLSENEISRCLVAYAHRLITRHKPEYAPDFYEINKKISEVINKENTLFVDVTFNEETININKII